MNLTVSAARFLASQSATVPRITQRLTRSPARNLVLSLGLSVALLAGCGSSPTKQPLDAPPLPVATDARLDGSIRADTDDPRIAQLWSAAQQARADGDDQRALDLLAEGLEVNPQNGLFWSRAAQIQLENANPGQAEKYAAKSNEYAGGNSALLLRNWLIIRHARNARGDLLGVRMAEKRVQQYQQE